MKHFKIILLIISITCTSCTLAQNKRNAITPKIVFQEAADDRIILVKDSSKLGTYMYKVKVLPGDTTRNGNRAEIAFHFNNKNGYKYQYSWDFYVSSKHQQINQWNYKCIIAQWWNGPAKGQSEADIKGKQQPPFYLFLAKYNDSLILRIYYGLQGRGGRVVAEQDFECDKWYHVSATAYWSLDSTGYVDLSINNNKYELHGANKYNNVSNVFKLGLYRNINNVSITEEYIKNIKIFSID